MTSKESNRERERKREREELFSQEEEGYDQNISMTHIHDQMAKVFNIIMVSSRIKAASLLLASL